MLRLLNLFVLLLICASQVFSQNRLVSGQAIKNGSPGGIGYFSLPSLTGVLMGIATVNDDEFPDVFMQADARAPGTYLYHFKKLTDKGEPVFSEGIKIKLPFEDAGQAKGVVIQDQNKKIYGFWRSSGKSIKASLFDKKINAFEQSKDIPVNGLPRGFSTFGVVETAEGKYLFLFTVAKEATSPVVKMKVDSAYYTPEGFWPNELPEVGIYGAYVDNLQDIQSLNAQPLTDLNQTYYGISGYTGYRIENNDRYVVCGTRLGNIHVYKIEKNGLSQTRYIVNQKEILQRNPTINAYPIYFNGPGSAKGLLTSGEGGIFFYKNTGKKDKKGNLVFEDPAAIFQEKAVLYGGSLVVPSMADWDGDGVLDIVSGNSAGNILFFKNTGSNINPLFQNPVALEAGGEKIHIQPGYREDIQGPGEARWGYTCPVVYDWNKDGLPDILTGDSRGKFMIYINKGNKTKPQLDVEQSLYVNGMNVHGGWRSIPGVAEMNGKNVYVILDRDNDFHLYYQLDTYNVEDGGKLKLTDGKYINGHRRKGGQFGRAKTHIVDWDGDGVKDMLVGTGRGASIPNPTTGLPYNRKKKNEGAAVLFLRNAGTDAQPVFEYPRMMKFKGEDILLGAHECAPTTGYLGGDGKTLNLVVGTEYGTFIYYDRKDLSW